MGTLYKGKTQDEVIGYVTGSGKIYQGMEEYSSNYIGTLNEEQAVFLDGDTYRGHVSADGNIYNSYGEQANTCVGHVDAQGNIYRTPGSRWMPVEDGEKREHIVANAKSCTMEQAGAAYLLLMNPDVYQEKVTHNFSQSFQKSAPVKSRPSIKLKFSMPEIIGLAAVVFFILAVITGYYWFCSMTLIFGIAAFCVAGA